MTKKSNILNSLLSINILLDRTLEGTPYGEVRPFCTHELRRIRKAFENHKFSRDILELVDCAIAYSDNIESFSYALDDLLVAVECL